MAYQILNEEPEPPTALRSGLPIELDRVIGKALAKNPDEPYQHADEFAVDLRGLQRQLERKEKPSSGTTPLHASIPKWKLQLPWALFAVAVLLLGLTVWLPTRNETPNRPALVRFSFVPDGSAGSFDSVAISPNGRHIAYVHSQDPRIWIRDLDSEQPRLLEGTDGRRTYFWSPDSRFLAFAADGFLKKVPSTGGPAVSLCPLPSSRWVSGTWSSDGESIVFGSSENPLH